MFQILAAAASVALQAGGHSHSAPPAATAGFPTPAEGGQSAYAALAEIVSILAADPNTDWSKVDVEALRSHLVDMDNVTLRARVTTEKLSNGARFRVTGSGDVAGSIQRMTGSHFTSGNVPGGWDMNTIRTPDGAIVTITSTRAADAARIQALGFFGILTMGGHHQPHHLMIARGLHH